MKTRINNLFFLLALTTALITLFIPRTASAQTIIFNYTGTEMTITLNPGTYDITAYGAQGGSGSARVLGVNQGGLGAEMEGQFSFTAPTTLTLLVGGSGISLVNGYGGGGGGGGSFVVTGSNPLVIAGGGGGGLGTGGSGLTGTSGGTGGDFNGGIFNGGGGSGGNGGYSGTYAGYGYGVSGGGGGGFYGGGGGGGYSGGGGGGNNGGGGGGSIIDSSAIMVLAEISGVASPDGSPNGEIIITAVPEPTSLALAGLSGLTLLLFRRQRK